eukprot:gene661-1278_t
MIVENFSYLLVISASLLCYLPIYLGFRLQLGHGENLSTLPVSLSLREESFLYCLVGCIGATVPTLFDFAIDSFGPTTRHLQNAKIAMWILFLSAFGANAFIFFFIAPNLHVEYWPSTICCKILLIGISALFILNAYGPHIWRWRYIVLIIISVSISQLLRVFEYFVASDNTQTFRIMRLLFQIAALIPSIILILVWFRYIFLKKRSSIPLSMDDIYCTINLVVYSAVILVVNISSSFVGSAASPYADTQGLCVHTYAITAVAIVITMLNSRYIRAKIVLTHTLTRPEPMCCIDISTLVEEIFGSCESAVDILNDTLLYEGLDKEEIILVKNSILAIDFLENKMNKELAHARHKDINLLIDLADVVGVERGGILHGSGRNIREIRVNVDEEKFGQVIRSLISNAIQCTPSGGNVTISVSVKQHQQQQRQQQLLLHRDSLYRLHIAVKDGGIKLSQWRRKRIGTMGLMKLHNGNLTIRSSDDENQGNIFTVELPLSFAAVVLASDDEDCLDHDFNHINNTTTRDTGGGGGGGGHDIGGHDIGGHEYVISDASSVHNTSELSGGNNTIGSSTDTNICYMDSSEYGIHNANARHVLDMVADVDHDIDNEYFGSVEYNSAPVQVQKRINRSIDIDSIALNDINGDGGNGIFSLELQSCKDGSI